MGDGSQSFVLLRNMNHRNRRLNILMATLSSPVSGPAYYERALRRFHNVITFGPYRDRSFWVKFASDLRTHYFYKDGASEHWADLCTRLTKKCDIVVSRGVYDIAMVLDSLPANFRPDLLIWFEQLGENVPLGIEVLKCPKVAIFGDTHLTDNAWRLKYAAQFDFVFLTFNKHHMPEFENAGCKHVHWSPAACDPEVNCKIPAEKIYPVSFVGSTDPYLHHERVTLINDLLENAIDVFVDQKFHQDMSLIYSRSKVVLNRSVADDFNMRVFEVLASGAFLLTNRLPRESGLEELFSEGTHLAIYDNKQDLKSKLEYFLTHDEEREAIAKNGYNEVLQKHTYDHRVDQILRTVFGGSAS